MRIGIDLHTINDFMQGSRTYVYNVTRCLLERDRCNEYELYFTKREAVLPEEFRYPHVRTGYIAHSRALRLLFDLPMKLAAHKVDVFHCQYIGPLWTTTPYIVTLHDIIHEVAPQLYPPMQRRFMSLLYPISARRAAKVLTVSNYSKQAIIDIYGVPEENIVITHDAAADEFKPIDDAVKIQAVQDKYQTSARYILFVGRLEPRKNVPTLIKAFDRLKARHHLPHKLVIAGMKDFAFQDVFKTAARAQSSEDILFTGGIDQEDLPLLYNGAEMFVYPSFAEGFGIPPLEAMACGTPVITSNTSSLPEVVGEAGIMVDPHNMEALSDAMGQVTQDEVLQREMREKGLRQSQKFSWSQTAETVLRVYEEVVSK